jgi:hypothetical protein
MQKTIKKGMALAYQGLVEGGTQSLTELRLRLKWGEERTRTALFHLEDDGLVTLGTRTRPFRKTYTAVKSPEAEARLKSFLPPPEAAKPPEVEITLKGEQVYVVFAALIAMVRDVHSVQDNLDEAQWEVAERLDQRFEELANAHRQSKP